MSLHSLTPHHCCLLLSLPLSPQLLPSFSSYHHCRCCLQVPQPSLKPILGIINACNSTSRGYCLYRWSFRPRQLHCCLLKCLLQLVIWSFAYYCSYCCYNYLLMHFDVKINTSFITTAKSSIGSSKHISQSNRSF